MTSKTMQQTTKTTTALDASHEPPRREQRTRMRLEWSDEMQPRQVMRVIYTMAL